MIAEDMSVHGDAALDPRRRLLDRYILEWLERLR